MEIAIITGASSGLGKEFVIEVLKQYESLDEIWIIARREQRLSELKERLSDKIKPIAMDITGYDEITRLQELLKKENANVKLLINNAGFGKLGDFKNIKIEDSQNMIRLNCEALTLVTGVVIPFMSENSEIINSCSIASFVPNARMAVYSATKAYVMSFSQALRTELKPSKINVLAVCPGPMETEFLPIADISKGASKTFDRLPRVSPAVVAKKSLAASKKHKSVYTCRFFYKFYRVVAKILPLSITLKMAKA